MIELILGTKRKLSIEFSFHRAHLKKQFFWPHYIRPATGESGFRCFGAFGFSLEFKLYPEKKDYVYRATTGRKEAIFLFTSHPYDAFERDGKRFVLMPKEALGEKP